MTFEDALRLYQEKILEDPISTWFFVNSKSAVQNAYNTPHTALLKDNITTIEDFARIVVMRKHPEKIILNADDRILIFSDIAGRSKLAENKKPLPLPFISKIVSVYTSAESDRVTIPEISEKHQTIGSIIAEYKTWCRDHNALDSISMIEEAINILKTEGFNIEFAIFGELRPSNVLEEELIQKLSSFPHIEFPLESDIKEAMELHQFRKPETLKSLDI
ncbi:MAG TPA: hypothetical protein O0X32_01165, partial [Methanocorpusculum sp.]|nr:hypothetical protein [Methanocorpusculum sp.]